MEDKYIVILGPTATGKTALSIELAKKTNGEIISADSMYVYKGMDIGTAKPHEKEQEGVPHHLIDIVNPEDDFSVYDYQVLSQRIIKDIKSRGKLPMVVGGTGLFIRALTEDFSLNNIPQDLNVRNKYEEIMAEKGKDYLHNLLKDKDPFAFDKLHPNDYRRVIRALEVYELTNTSIYTLQQRKNVKNMDILYIGLTMDREKLYHRINKRVEIMLENGLVDEVEGLLDRGVPAKCNSMKGIGYRQVLQYLNGEISYDKMVEILKRDTRNYAKRQLTWFKAMDNVLWMDMLDTPIEEAMEKILTSMQEKNIFPRINN